MIYKYIYGNPIQTDSVVMELPACESELLYLSRVQEGGLYYSYTMADTDVVYGLGENVGGINKRGGIYESNCSDVTQHTEDKRSLYGAHNFLLVHGAKTFGLFLDFPGKITFDVGHTSPEQLTITPEEENLVLYLIEGQTLTQIVKEFRTLIGTSYIPPKWAFGYGQSRWGYRDEKDIREVVAGYRNNDLPLDMIYLDIDYMDSYKDFTVDTQAFPDLEGLTDELKKDGIRLIPIIDAGVKIEEGYDVYEEGVKNDYFCKDAEGENFVAGVWPGRVHFPDVLNREARDWFGKKYKFLLDQGIEGFWNDMNEPAMFYSQKHLQEVFGELDSLKGENMNIDIFFHFQDIMRGITNNPEDYRSFYHKLNGEQVRHDKVHNLYGYNMTRAAAEAFEELKPNQRLLLFSRSSCIGMHRYGGIWTGDNSSWWAHLLLNIQMMPSLNMCGFLYCGADLGGFNNHTTQELLLRWLQFGIFTPLMRNHSAIGTRLQELYQFEKLDTFRNMLQIRYGIIPYLYSEYMKAALNSEMIFRPLAFDYPEDIRAAQVEDQLMLGDGLMLAPIYQKNARGRSVYLPEPMKMYRLRSLEDMESEILEQGYHYIDIALEELVIFLRPDHIIPLSYGAKHTQLLNEEELFLLGFVKTRAEYRLYQDDGVGMDYDNPSNYTTITVENSSSCVTLGSKKIEIREIK
jgi:alpha-glucosidase